MALLPLVPLLGSAALAVRSAELRGDDTERRASLELARTAAAAPSAFAADVRRSALPIGEALAARRLSRAESRRLLARAVERFDGQLVELS